MKIAFILYHWPVLSETFVLNQITGLLDRGHDVDVFAKSPGKQPIVHDAVEKYQLLERTFYYQTARQKPPANRIVRFFKAGGLLLTHFHQDPVLLLNALNVFKYRKKAALLILFYRVLPFLKADQYDIVHCHFGPNGNFAVSLKELGAIKGKILTSFHGESSYALQQNKYLSDYSTLFEQGDAILPMSDKEKEDLIKLGCSAQKIVVHRMGVDLSQFIYKPRQPDRDGKIQLLSVARLAPKKGLAYGIRAVAEVLKKHPHLEYNIVGDGPLKEELQALINSLGVQENVKLLGWKRQEEVIQLTQAAHIFLAPSIISDDGDQEGIPVSIMEAMAQGLPVLSTLHAGIPELIREGESGFLVPERDVDALANRLAYLVEHPERWPEMGEAGRNFIEEFHNVDKLNDQLVQLYERLLADQTGTAAIARPVEIPS